MRYTSFGRHFTKIDKLKEVNTLYLNFLKYRLSKTLHLAGSSALVFFNSLFHFSYVGQMNIHFYTVCVHLCWTASVCAFHFSYVGQMNIHFYTHVCAFVLDC